MAAQSGASARSSVDLPEDDVLRTDDGDDIGNHVTTGHLIERLEVGKAGGTDLEPVRHVGAVRHQVNAELTLGCSTAL